MPNFQMSYAYDVPCYTDFTVEAETAEAALAIAQDALKRGCLLQVSAEPSWDNMTNARVFDNGGVADDDCLEPMTDLEGFDPDGFDMSEETSVADHTLDLLEALAQCAALGRASVHSHDLRELCEIADKAIAKTTGAV